MLYCAKELRKQRNLLYSVLLFSLVRGAAYGPTTI
jgi:hypothetical protein